MHNYSLDELIESVANMAFMEGVAPPKDEVIVKPSASDNSKLKAEDLMHKIRSGENWHSNMLLLIAHWIGRKFSDAEIMMAANSFTLSGYTVDQTKAEMQEMIQSGREKWAAENPENLIGSRPLVAMNLEDFLNLEIPPRELILSPIIPTQGLTMLYAVRGLGKTFTALAIGLAVATGTSMFAERWKAPKPRRILYLDGEMPAVMQQERLKHLAANCGVPLPESDYFRIISPDHQEYGIQDIATEEGRQAVEEHLKGVELLILDNLSALLRQGKENEAESWMPIQGWLLSLRRRGISVLIVHHAGKAGHQRGTSKKEDLLDTVVSLKKLEKIDPDYGAQFEVHYEKARGFYGDDAKPFTAKLNKESSKWEILEVAESIEERIANLHATGLSQHEIAEHLGTSQSSVSRKLKAQKKTVEVQDEIPF